MTPYQRRSAAQLVLVFAGAACALFADDDELYRRIGSLCFLASVLANLWPVPREA